MPLVDISARLDAQGHRWRGYLAIPVVVEIRISGDANDQGSVVVFFGVQLFMKFLSLCTDANGTLSQRVSIELAETYRTTAEAVYVPDRVFDSLRRSRIDLAPLQPSVNRVALPRS
jgi:hypothetical protein